MSTTYTTRDEAIQREITDGIPLEYADHFDIRAIADEVLEWVDGWSAVEQMYITTSQGYRIIEDVDLDDVMARHAVRLPDSVCDVLGVDVDNADARQHLLDSGVDVFSLRDDSPEVALALALYPNA